jgi:5'-3' exonuclease
LIDGTYELFRAHYSPRPGHALPTGQDLKATVGVVSSLLYLLHDATEDVTHVAVAFDNPIRSFRNDLYPFYKSDEGVEPALRAQFDTVEEAVRAIGVAVWSMKEFEADDGLAAGAARFRDEVDQVRIMTPDKDLGQCIRGTRVVQVDRRQMKVTDEAAFRERRGFAPQSMADYLALTGDAADGFPGLPGFGEKTAGMLIGAYGTIEAIPLDAARWTVKPRGAAQLVATLAERREEAFLYRKLATLDEAAPVATSLQDVRFDGVPRERFEAWCGEVGSRTLAGVPRRWALDPDARLPHGRPS